jgi:phosphoribosylformylglycinamidine (FGAM) synthase-like enzyme
MSKQEGSEVSLETDNLLGTLFGERIGRIIVAADPAKADELEKLAAGSKTKFAKIGIVGGNNLVIRINGEEVINIAREKYTDIYEKTIRTIMVSLIN